ncbi:hypothetical protein, partial [Acidithiobacillus ferridurans]|uniref:hypothetical protein n=1 Tax=Acidithiobacillus ferridurans TaxID=1232575 RepID=UPI001C06836F
DGVCSGPLIVGIGRGAAWAVFDATVNAAKTDVNRIAKASLLLMLWHSARVGIFIAFPPIKLKNQHHHSNFHSIWNKGTFLVTL